MNAIQVPNISLLHNLMDKAYEEGKIKEALSYAKCVIQVDPSYDAYFDYALLAKELSLYKQALYALEQAIVLNPKNPDAYVEKALVLYEMDELQEAYYYLIDLRNLLLDETPWALLAILAGELNLLEEAIFYASKAIKYQPNSWSYHARAIVYQINKSYDLASADFQHALSLDPYNPELWNSYALLFEEILAYDHALEIYNTAINQIELNHYFLYLNRAKIHHILNKKDLAIIDCQLALQQVSNNGDIWFLFASLLHEQGNLNAALQAYNQSLKYIKKDASIHFCKAKLLEEIGNIAQAKASYEKALKFDKNNPEIRLAFANFLLRYNLSIQVVEPISPQHHIKISDKSLFP